jgi:hypothetical protein
MNLTDRTRGVLNKAIDIYRGTGHDARLVTLRQRLDEPMRVAIAGRVKSGKSTLLNALVGERLAPTDAGECTRIVTWYQDGHTYQVMAKPRQGQERQLRFEREDDAIQIDLGGLKPVDVDQMVVTWPSQTLRTATLIDTPGIGSLSEDTSRRAWELLAAESDEETPADAVLYLMRHLHAGDLEFLRAFHDNEVSRPTRSTRSVCCHGPTRSGWGGSTRWPRPGASPTASPPNRACGAWCRPSYRWPVCWPRPR